MPRRKKQASDKDKAGVASITYAAKRKNIPPAGLEAHGVVRETPKVRYEFNPHLPPELRFSPDAAAADRLPELLAEARRRPLSADEAGLLTEALQRHEPWLEWSGKRERPWFEVDPVALHMHERVSTQAILRVLARQDVQRDLFADPQLDYARAVQFYRHDVDWANRMILGDSLQVMASLARRENLAGKVQMIYVDPPYGIRFASNFQPQLGQRDVKDRRQDLTREPEMVKAYRDTWTLGIHSYLALSARSSRDGPGAARRYREHLRPDQRREPAPRPLRAGRGVRGRELRGQHRYSKEGESSRRSHPTNQ